VTPPRPRYGALGGGIVALVAVVLALTGYAGPLQEPLQELLFLSFVLVAALFPALQTPTQVFMPSPSLAGAIIAYVVFVVPFVIAGWLLAWAWRRDRALAILRVALAIAVLALVVYGTLRLVL
jgi:hypothetical protein